MAKYEYLWTIAPSGPELNELGLEGWMVVGVDAAAIVLMRVLSTSDEQYEHKYVYPADEDILNKMGLEGWRAVAMAKGQILMVRKTHLPESTIS